MPIFLKNYFAGLAKIEYFYPFIILILSVFIIFFQLSGSLGSYDESIYSEVAKEGLLNNNWLETFYEGKVWIDKPPFLIWITMAAYKIFGINEFAARFFPAFFGILGILSIYILAKQLFNYRIAFLSSLVLLAIPHYLLLSRTNITDIFLFVFVNFSFIFLLRSFRNRKEIILSGVFLGLAFMTKSAVALFFVLLFIAYIYLKKDPGAIKNRYFIFTIVLFLVITVPWHLYMFLKYGNLFLDGYLGYHLIRRFNENIIVTPFIYDNLFYLRVIAERTASWWFVFLAMIPIFRQRLKISTDAQNIKFLLSWAFFVLIFFTLAATKLQQYIFPFYTPFAILLGYGLYHAIRSMSNYLLLAFLAVFINMSASTIKTVSDISEARLLVPKILSSVPFLYLLSYGLLSAIFLFLTLSFIRKKMFGYYAAVILIFVFSLLLPFYPDRRPEAPKINDMLLSLGVEKLYIYNADYLKKPLVFYGYPKYNIIEPSPESAKKIKKTEKLGEGKGFCIFKGDTTAVLDMFPCELYY